MSKAEKILQVFLKLLFVVINLFLNAFFSLFRSKLRQKFDDDLPLRSLEEIGVSVRRVKGENYLKVVSS